MACPQTHGIGAWPEGSYQESEGMMMCGSCRRVFPKVVPVFKLDPNAPPPDLGVSIHERPSIRERMS